MGGKQPERDREKLIEIEIDLEILNRIEYLKLNEETAAQKTSGHVLKETIGFLINFKSW